MSITKGQVKNALVGVGVGVTDVSVIEGVIVIVGVIEGVTDGVTVFVGVGVGVGQTPEIQVPRLTIDKLGFVVINWAQVVIVSPTPIGDELMKLVPLQSLPVYPWGDAEILVISKQEHNGDGVTVGVFVLVTVIVGVIDFVGVLVGVKLIVGVWVLVGLGGKTPQSGLPVHVPPVRTIVYSANTVILKVFFLTHNPKEDSGPNEPVIVTLPRQVIALYDAPNE